MTLLLTRLQPPRRERNLVMRAQLDSVLQQSRGMRVVLLQASAGYGKSLLMGQMHAALAAAGERIGWVSVAELDGKARELARYLLAALQEADSPDMSQEFDLLLAPLPEASIGPIATAVCDALQRRAGPLTLFVDDLHVLDGTPAIALLVQVVRDAPAGFRLVVATRTAPALDLARLRVRGELLELGTDRLRFTSAETRDFLSAVCQTPVSDEVASIALDRTEGWPAGLQLVSLPSAEGDDLGQRLRRFTGADRTVGAYLREDLLGGMNADVNRFLAHSSVLRQFTPALCDRVLDRTGSAGVIAQLERSGVFIFSLDGTGEWFRYHHLFREHLERQLEREQPELRRALHERAAQALCALHMPDEALHHAFQVADLQLAAAILDRECEDAFGQGRLWSLAHWIERVPEELLDGYPRMQLARVWSLTLELRFEAARDILERVVAKLPALRADGRLDRDQAADLDRIVLHRKMMLAQFADDLWETERLCDLMMVDFPSDREPFLRGTLDASLANTHREFYRLDTLDALDRSAREYIGRVGLSYPLVFHESIVGSSCLQRGDLGRAESAYRHALEIAQEIAGPRSSLAAMPAVLLGRLQLERSEFAAARTILDAHLGHAGKVGFLDQLIAGFIGRARLAALDGDARGADEVLARGAEYAAAGAFSRLHWHVAAERIRQALLAHDLKRAQQIALQAGLPADGATLRPKDGVTGQIEAMASAWIRLALGAGSAHPAYDLARRWIVFTEARRCLRSELAMRLLAVNAKLAAGDAAAATRMCIEALDRAQRSGLTAMLVEEGEPLRRLVCRLLDIDDVGRKAKEIARSIAGKLARGIGPVHLRPEDQDGADAVATATDNGAWNKRELEIIALVAEGAQNKEVGARLGLTEGTVKWYMRQIFNKLGTRRRLDAVRRARALGLVG